MYNQDKINELAKRYVESEDDADFIKLLQALEPMIQKILLRYPKYAEHQEDLKQEVMIKIFNNFKIGSSNRKNKVDLKRVFEKNIPASYFFYRIKEQILHSISKVDSGFQVKKLKRGRLRKKIVGYDMYDEMAVGFEDLTEKEKAEFGIDAESNGEYWG
jgi:hypothetical protein